MSAGIAKALELKDRLKAIHNEQARRRGRDGLLNFIAYVRPDYKINWHHRLVCAEIDKWLVADDPYNLILSMPPQHGKSEICSRYLPPYLFGLNPDAKIIAASYASNLIEGMSRDAQRVIDSPQYHDLFPNTTIPRKGNVADETAIRRADEWTIQRHGGRFRCAGVGGSLTGHPAVYGIIDDPVKDFQAAESKTTRQSTAEWYYTVFRTRLHGMGRTLMLLTRWHVDDLAGVVLKKMEDDPEADQWRQIIFPAVCEEALRPIMHSGDPREEGQALWPAFQDERHFTATRATIGGYHWHCLYQQRPQPPGGSRIKRSWLQVIERAALPCDLIWVRFWDLAVTEKTKADFTASGMMAIDQYKNIYVKDYIHEQQEWPVVKRMFIQQAVTDQTAVGIETSGTQAGFFQDLLTEEELHDIPVYGYSPDKSKLVRAQPWIARAEAGKFFMVRGPGLDDCIDELVEFTGTDDTHDDQVDWISGAYHMFAQDEEPEIEVIGDCVID